MTIDELRLINFRNHINTKLEFVSGTNLILGGNGVGKTTILEAIDTLCLGKSGIARKDNEIIHHEKDFATAQAYTTHDDTKSCVVIQFLLDKSTDRVSKRLIINDKSHKFADLHYRITTVAFYPDDLSIITGEPAKRRKYLDSVLIKTHKYYKGLLSDYTKIILQRNKLLETISKYNTGHIQLEYWNIKFIEIGNQIIDERTKLTEYLNSNIGHNLTKLNTNIDVILSYKSQRLSSELLQENNHKELKYKATIVGPHRDDLKIESPDKLNIASFGSRGEQRTALLGIKLTEIDYVKYRLEKKPILLLDDIFSELDQKHKESVIDTIVQYQTIITSAEQVPLKGNIIHL